MSTDKIRVLVVDDSAAVRQSLTQILESDPEISVIASAADPYVAVRHIAKETPDVITLDVEMPRMDGITFLEKIMSQHPIPVVMCSSLTTEGSEIALRALERGAVDIIEKPKLGTRQFFEESRIRICDVVKSAAKAKLEKLRELTQEHLPPPLIRPTLSADAILPAPTSQSGITTSEKVVVVGASTGGTEALRVFLAALPSHCPGIVIVQHMPEHFTACFAKRLNALCRIEVKEAENGDAVARGRALIAPGNHHLLLKRTGDLYRVEVNDGPFVSRHRPSVNVLFRSAARYAGRNAIGVIMTGMGADGATGMKELKDAGAYTLAQDEASSVIFGMPHEAIKAGGVDRVLPLDLMAAEIMNFCR